MLAIIAVVAAILPFFISPNISFLEVVIEQQLKIVLATDKVDVEKVVMLWDDGPALDIGHVNIEAGRLSIQNSQVSLRYSLFQPLEGDIAPTIILSGGTLTINMDAEGKDKSSPVNVATNLQDVQLDWIYQKEKQSLKHVHAELLPYASHLSLIAEGVQLSLGFSEQGVLTKAHFKLEDTGLLPKAYQEHFKNITELVLDAKHQGEKKWSWELKTTGEQGGINAQEIHFKLPYDSIEAEGNIAFSDDETLRLEHFEATKLLWHNGENYADLSLNWSDNLTRLKLRDGSTDMPLLWSWLWMLGEDEWHDWLNSMHSGRIHNVRATVELDWVNPLHTVPTHQNLIDMKYHVLANGEGIDIALGLGGDFLYQLEGKVLVDEKHLKADVKHTVLKDGIATGTGTYRIDWDTLLMTIKATGLGDVGRLHNWLDAGSAEELNWGKSPASAMIEMEWDAHKSEPNKTVVTLKPTGKPWLMNYKGIAIKALQGDAVWDFSRGLDIKHMQVELPWLEGDFTMFLDKNHNWDVSTILFDGHAPLSELTEAFVLPITNPTGMSKVHAVYESKKWHGTLDLSENDWDNFAGYDKEGEESLKIPFYGMAVSGSLLPIHIQSLKSEHDNFAFDASILITDKSLDFQFEHVESSAFRGDFRLYMPLDATQAWGLEVDADYMNKPVLTSYLSEKGGAEAFTRPWSVNGHIEWVEWEKSTANHVDLKFSSDKASVGELKVGYFLSGDMDLENIEATFSIDGKGKYDLHYFKALGSDQKLKASGSVQVQKDGALRWKGLALMGGKFGTLMEQAELDKLFKEGDMSAVFIGTGEYKEGEPWWREMKGSFKLKVDDGRILEGGTLTHLLAAISLVDLPKYLVLDRGDVVGEGLFYDRLQVEALFEGKHLKVQNLGFLSSALDAGGKGSVDLETGHLDLVLVARPWQNIESFIAKVPIMGSILTGEDKSLKRSIYRIHGPASNAAVDEVSAEDVGLPKGGYLEDLFTPSKWFEPRKKVEEKVP